MKYILPILVVIVACLFGGTIYGQNTTSKSEKVNVRASVGDFYLSISGFQSPYASIVLTTLDAVYLRSTVADENGNFSISQVLINRGFSGFCLTAVDVKRLGETSVCINIPPATSSVIMNDIFLPPTIGLSRTEIGVGATVTAFGYTMPGAAVILYISDGTTLNGTADATGYYEFVLENLGVGQHDIFATAQYQGKTSLTPNKKVAVKVLTAYEQGVSFLRDLWNKLLRLFTSLGGFIWLAVALIILIIILLLKLWPERFTFIYNSKLGRLLTKLPHRGEKKLHHWWFVGY